MKARAAQAKRRWLSIGSLTALALGFSLGTWSHGSADANILALVSLLNPVGSVWVNALRMVVVPLVVAQLVYTLVLAGSAGSVGRLTSTSFLVFAGLLMLGAGLTITIMPAALARLEFSPDALAALRSASVVPPPSQPVAPPATGQWLINLVPPNVFRAASQDNLLGVMIFAIAFGVAVGRMSPARRALVAELFQTIGEAMMTIVGWILWLMPLAVFILALGASSSAGIGAFTVIATFVVLLCAVLCIFTGLQYVLAALFGRVSIRRFAAALFPVQLVAVGTRSSIAALPLLLERARDDLGLRAEVSAVVMPLAVSTFKINRSISSPLQFLFLAHVYGVDLSLGQILMFTTFAILLSFTTIGIPSGGSLMRSAPLYVAAGIPIEGYLLAEAAESIPDIFKTLLNVTGNMTAAAIVNRVTAPTAPVADGAPDRAAGELAAGV